MKFFDIFDHKFPLHKCYKLNFGPIKLPERLYTKSFDGYRCRNIFPRNETIHLNMNRTESIFTLLFLLGLIKYNNHKQEISLTKRSIKGSQSSIEEHDNQQNDDIQNSFDIEVDGAIELTENSILPKWNHKTKFAFIHIGKTGGTSFDAGMRKWLNINILNTKLYIGKRHYDWSYYKNLKDESSQEIHPLTWLRHPVDRAISHFNFMKQLAWERMLLMFN